MYESEELLTAPRAVCSEQHKCNGLNIKVMQNPLKTTERLCLNPEDFESRPTRVKSAVLEGFLRGSCGKLEKWFQFIELGDYWGFKLLLLQNHWFNFFPLPAHDTTAQEHRASWLHEGPFISKNLPFICPPRKDASENHLRWKWWMLLLHAQKEAAPDRRWWRSRHKSFYRHPDLPCMEFKLLKWAFHYIISEINLESEDDVKCGSLLLALASHWFHNCHPWLSLNGFLHKIQGLVLVVKAPRGLRCVTRRLPELSHTPAANVTDERCFSEVFCC